MSIPTTTVINETINGRAFDVGPLPMSGLGRLQKHLDKLPYPKDLAAILRQIDADMEAGIYTEDEAIAAKREAKAERSTWPPEVLFDPRTRYIFMYDDEARAEILAAALMPKLTPDEAREMSLTVSIPQFMRIYAAAFAIDDGEPTDPKADGTTDAPGPA